MTTTAIRKRLIIYLADANDKRVKAIYTLIKDEINQEVSCRLIEKHVKVLDDRRARNLSGKDNSFSWQNVHKRVKKKRKTQ